MSMKLELDGAKTIINTYDYETINEIRTVLLFGEYEVL